MALTRVQTLLALVKEKKIDMFHKSWKPGHGTTDFERYYASPPGHIYRVNGYQHSYEPYVIFKREGTPWSVLQAREIHLDVALIHPLGVTCDLLVMGLTKLLAFLSFTYLACLSTSFQTTSSFTKGSSPSMLPNMTLFTK